MNSDFGHKTMAVGLATYSYLWEFGISDEDVYIETFSPFDSLSDAACCTGLPHQEVL